MPNPGVLELLTIQLRITGDGRNDVVTRTPVTPSTFGSFSPPGGLSTNGQFTKTRFNLQNGFNTVLQPSSQPQGYPLRYFVMVPPTDSSNGKVLMGANQADFGIVLIPNMPLVLAIPTAQQQSNWPTITIFAQQGQGELVDIYLV